MKTIFLVHSSQNKDFVTKLANDLRKNGVHGQIDETILKIGDLLTHKIGCAISNADFIGACLSKSSVRSNWVKNELNIALTKEINEKIIFVLPLLLEDCEIPSFLIGRLYADFTDESNYSTELDRLLLTIKHNRAGSNNSDSGISKRLGIADKLTSVKIEQLHKELGLLMIRDENLFVGLIHFQTIIDEIETDRGLRISKGHDLLSYKREITRIKEDREKIRHKISKIQMAISNSI